MIGENGDSTRLRRWFAFWRINECYKDLPPVDRPLVSFRIVDNAGVGQSTDSIACRLKSRIRIRGQPPGNIQH